MSIYENYYDTMNSVMHTLVRAVEENSRRHESACGAKLFEHLRFRIKDEASMREKLARNGKQANAYHALRAVTDSIGLRIVCLFIDDVYENAALLRNLPGCTVVKEKDYIQNAKSNGYRSYHMILDVETDAPDVDGNTPGHYFVEVQLRTIAMDTWAALEHEMKYKKTIANPELIVSELRRCANELAACDVSMQTLRNIIRDS
ncbi:MAG: GTP pyrophosphokinase family protein [Clostridia bacterium]|nr:GTP pyrophosphokinase family protein [Clostridia bacterium]